MACKPIAPSLDTLNLAFILTLSLLILTTAASGLQESLPLDSELSQTPAEWHQAYQCPFAGEQTTNDTFTTGHHRTTRRLSSGSSELANRVPWWQRIWFKIMHVCNRDSNAWRYLYIDEILGARGYTPRIIDSSSDERLANAHYSLSLNGLADLSYFTFNSGDPKEDLENERRVAGPQVSEHQCDEDLTEMSAQFDELQERIARLRVGDTSARFQQQHVRLVHALDSYGRYEPSSIAGVTKFIGSYTQCEISLLDRQFNRKHHHYHHHQDEHTNEFPMRYCWAKLSTDRSLNELLKKRERLEHETGETTIQVGVCLPRSCHTKTLHKHKPIVQKFVDSQLQLPSTLYVNQSLDLESVFCLVDREGEFRMPLSGKLFFAFVACWLTACCVATHLRLGEKNEQAMEKNALEAAGGAATSKLSSSNFAANLSSSSLRTSEDQMKPSGMMRFLGHLNLRNSWNDFTSDKRQMSATARVDLDVLNPVKLFACGFCIAAHSALLLATVSARQGEIAAFVERDYIIQAALMASVVVDTFFVISGLLLTYIMLKKLAAGFGFGNHHHRASLTTTSDMIPAPTASSSFKSSSWILSPKDLGNYLANWFVLSLNRYLRLVPLYAIMFWFRRDALTYLGSGPMWDYGFNRNTMNGACNHETSLMPFTPLAAFVPLNKQCFVPSWSVSNDILCAAFLPPIILLFHRRAKLGIYVTCTLLMVAVINSVRGYIEAEPQNRWELGEFRLHGIILYFNGLSHLYSSPFYRVSGYLVGTLAGYFLFKYDHQDYGQSTTKAGQWPSWLRNVATPASAIYLIVHTICSVQAMQIKALFYPYQRLIAAFFATVDRPIWAAANAILFLRMVTDWRLQPMMQAWAGQTYRTLARLNFALLFTHWIFIVIQTNVLVALPTFTAWQIYAQVASIYAAALPAAIFVHLVFENPLDKLIKRELFGL